MKKIIGYLGDYWKEQCNYRYLAVLMLLLAGAIAANFGYKSEDDWIKADPSEGSRLVKYLLGYTVVFGGAYALQAAIDYKDKRLRSGKLWILIFFAILLFSVRAWWHLPYPVLQQVPDAYYSLLYKLVSNLTGLVALCLPCWVYWLVADRKREPFYGFHAKGVVLWPYFVLILLMLPLLLWAGTQPDFQETYPRAARLRLTPDLKYYTSGTVAYEMVYSLDYVVTEFFFRGFLILAFARFVGPKAILPMCAFYVAIHFDKPLGECISSFFGGAILGVLAYRTRSIYGGIIVHLGIAMGMEIIGWVHK
jgi:membrane protease YdiL (CAAX protease family)